MQQQRVTTNVGLGFAVSRLPTKDPPQHPLLLAQSILLLLRAGSPHAPRCTVRPKMFLNKTLGFWLQLFANAHRGWHGWLWHLAICRALSKLFFSSWISLLGKNSLKYFYPKNQPTLMNPFGCWWNSKESFRLRIALSLCSWPTNPTASIMARFSSLAGALSSHLPRAWRPLGGAFSEGDDLWVGHLPQIY